MFPCRFLSSSLVPRHSATQRGRAAFTLIELLGVLGIVLVLMVLVVPAFTTIKSADDLASDAYAISGVLEQARTYAKVNNTYTWVGFYEENTTATAPTNNPPPYPGKGRLLVATVCSKDGTKIFQDSDPPASLPLDRISQLGKLITIEGLHLTDIGNPSPTPNPTPMPDTLAARPAVPYIDNSPNDHYNRVSSDSADTTKFTFTAQNYTFYKAIRFSPSGEANMNYINDVGSPLKRAGEIGVKPTHGTIVDTIAANLVAIQLTGVGGNVKIYRK